MEIAKMTMTIKQTLRTGPQIARIKIWKNCSLTLASSTMKVTNRGTKVLNVRKFCLMTQVTAPTQNNFSLKSNNSFKKGLEML
jgi:hypothetical protein